MKLKASFEEKIQQTPSVADNKPMGKGIPNRHGMAVIPIGETITKKWPVSDPGLQPEIQLKDWRLRIDGATEHPTILMREDFMYLPQTVDTSDLHCVTTLSKLNSNWKGVRMPDPAALVQPDDNAKHIMCYGYDDYTTNISLEEALKPDVLLVHTAEGRPLKEHGGPVYMITPQLYAWKSIKWINRIEFMTANRLGFWGKRVFQYCLPMEE